MQRLNVAGLRGLFAELGVGAALLYAVHRLLLMASGGRIVLHCFDLVVVPVSWRLRPALRSRSNIEVRLIGPDEAESFRLGPSEAEVARRFDRGNRCIAALRGGDVAGYVWIAQERFDESVVRCRFVLTPPARLVWDFDLFIDRAHRGGLTFAVLWEGVFSLLREWGYASTASRISVFNSSSKRAHRRMGSESIGKLLFLCAGSWQLMLGTLAPYLHLSRTEQAVPTVVLPLRADRIASDSRLSPR